MIRGSDDGHGRAARAGRCGRGGAPRRSTLSRSGMASHPRGEREGGRRARRASRDWSHTATSTTTSSRMSTRPGWSRKLKRSSGLADADADARRASAVRNEVSRAMTAAIERPQQRVGPERLEAGGRALEPADQDHRDGGDEAADRPHEGRHHLGADARQAGQVGVAGRRLARSGRAACGSGTSRARWRSAARRPGSSTCGPLMRTSPMSHDRARPLGGTASPCRSGRGRR